MKDIEIFVHIFASRVMLPVVQDFRFHMWKNLNNVLQPEINKNLIRFVQTQCTSMTDTSAITYTELYSI